MHPVAHREKGYSNITHTIATTIPVSLNMANTRALVDTGSASSIIVKALAKNCILKSTRVNLVTAGNIKLKVLGSTVLNFQINNESFSDTAYVIETSPYGLILGRQFLQKYRASINFGEKTVTLFNKNKPIKIWMDKEPHPNKQRTLCAKHDFGMEKIYHTKWFYNKSWLKTQKNLNQVPGNFIHLRNPSPVREMCQRPTEEKPKPTVRLVAKHNESSENLETRHASTTTNHDPSSYCMNAVNMPQENVSWLNSLEYECEPTDNALKKIRCSEDVILSNFAGKIVKTTLDQYECADLKNGRLDWQLNDKLFRHKQLILCKKPYYANNSYCVKISSKSAAPTKIYKDTTLFYLHKPYETMQVMSLHEKGEVINDVETEAVTLKDHIVDHIKDPVIKNNLLGLLEEYAEIFAKSPKHMGRTNLVKHKIELLPGMEEPVKSRAYRVSHKENEYIREQLDEMLEAGIITPSQSPWSSPVVLVKKRDGTRRFCVDYRKLNSKTKPTRYPLPLIDEILTYLGGCKFFTTLDLLSGYWQLELEESSREYTAFITNFGQFQFTVTPFGLCNAPGSFSELADRVFHDMKWKDVLIYLDDVIIFSKTVEEHLKKLDKVFERLRRANLTLKPSKCQYLKEHIGILGYEVDKDGIYPSKEKTAALREIPTPKRLRDVQSFLGAAGYYRKFIRQYSVISRPLHDLTKKDVKFHWGEPQQKAFDTLKDLLCKEPVLGHFCPSKPTFLHVDASKQGVGGVLLQENDNGVQHPIMYISRSLTKNEKNYSISELEGLAIVYILKSQRHLIYGRPITIYSDHSALCFLRSIKNTGRLCRYAIILSEFDYKIIHKKGCQNKDADCLSRYPRLSKEAEALRDEILEDIPTFALAEVHSLKAQEDRTTDCFHLSIEEIKEHQIKDENIKNLINILEDPENAPLALRKRAKQFRLKDGILHKINHSVRGLEDLLVIPRDLIGEILFQCHSDPLNSHFGLTKTLDKICNRFYWESMRKDVIKFVQGCPDCQARKGSKQKPAGELQPMEVGLPFQKIGIDLLGPFPRSEDGKTMIVVAIDYATRYVELKALPDGKSHRVAQFLLENICLRHGIPQVIHSDQAKIFTGEVFGELCKLLGVVRSFTSSYCPQSNGLVERQNAWVTTALSFFIGTNQRDWSKYVPFAAFSYNTAQQETTRFSPFELVFARDPVLLPEASLTHPSSIFDIEKTRQRALATRAIAVENILKKQKVDKHRFDMKHRPLNFKKGDKVRVFTPRRIKGRSDKLLLHFYGPYIVEEKVGNVSYKVRKLGDRRGKSEIIHVSRILPFYDKWTQGTGKLDNQTTRSKESNMNPEERISAYPVMNRVETTEKSNGGNVGQVNDSSAKGVDDSKDKPEDENDERIEASPAKRGGETTITPNERVQEEKLDVENKPNEANNSRPSNIKDAGPMRNGDFRQPIEQKDLDKIETYDEYLNSVKRRKENGVQTDITVDASENKKLIRDGSLNLRNTKTYTSFWKRIREQKQAPFKGLWTERDMDLFRAPKDYALGHCVSADFHMSKGIAASFKSRFKGVKVLLKQKKRVGEAAVLKAEGRFIYYLVTKEKYYEKPTYETLFEALMEMRRHMINNGIRKLALPKIGCGVDKLQWEIVSEMLRYIMSDLNITIVICSWNPESAMEKEEINGDAKRPRHTEVNVDIKEFGDLSTDDEDDRFFAQNPYLKPRIFK